MPSGITGRDGFLPALVKSIRRSFPCRHPTTGGSLKGSPAGTPLTHRFLYYSYSTTAAAVCQPSFCPGPQPAGRRDGPSREFASVFRYREKSPFGQQKSPIYSGFSQETSFLSPHYGADDSFARLASALADTHTAVETATGCFFALQPPFRISPPAPIKNPVGKKPSGFLAQMERFELSRRLPTLRP